ncbi:putative protein YcbX [Sinobacterium norvegicum]|uniref:MOSC domain-containing protein n=1 Tax=Sinobacterium norvegicum TaxID=1641715 RepID=A0ABN8EBT4_9GAMM|nr:MOSC N-terminal beta barrel domain-containing protein [Sinobacterium norvegicum]CAH0989973.1 putative protein YcbX [Sinobacterium norvegicum]
MTTVTVSELYIHPVKSLQGIAVEQVKLDKFGAQFDRRWMVVDPRGHFITQREVAAMATLSTAMIDGQLQLSDSQGESFLVAEAGDRVEPVVIWDDTVLAVDCGNAVAAWLTQRLATECRLVFMPQTTDRIVSREYSQSKKTVGFADGFPLMLVSQASLDEINSRLDHPVSMTRFRPNIVVEGCDSFAEDQWQALSSSQLQLDISKPCSRCVMPSLDPKTGRKHKTLNRVLASFRRRDGVIYVGQNLVIHRGDSIAVGDQLAVDC